MAANGRLERRRGSQLRNHPVPVAGLSTIEPSTSVPEPGPLATLALGLVGIRVVRRRHEGDQRRCLR
ncbi:PEP-CTERM sorting domain-containing protein [Pelagibius sp. Alg239-R121]|uniref:PEP-CTERM sorting domain-containing protein n=1 Tax=Pelagibius sp. Alg239-R121 TaxID=2993448 RepID=UPI00345F6623